jgi:hypothetical protein
MMEIEANATATPRAKGLESIGRCRAIVRTLLRGAIWAEVEYPKLGRKFRHAGSVDILNGSPWRISGRASLIDEHNEEVLCGEFGLPKTELIVPSEGGTV